jgi:hypothetical protein
MSGYFDHQTGKFIYVDDMEPEIIVSDLTDLKVNSIKILLSMKIFVLVKTLCFL